VLTLSYSWCRHKRSSSCREKEARKAQGSQDACLGQALILVLLLHFSLYTLYICTKFTMFSSNHYLKPDTSFLSLTLRSLLLRLLTQLSLWQLLQPPFLPLNLSNLEIILSSITPKHTTPPFNSILHPLFRKPRIPLPPQLCLCLARLIIIHRDISQLRSSSIRCQVFLETSSDECTCGISAGEKAVTASFAVDVAAGADVVDCAV
jgi:hypothetical protein